MEQSQLWVYRIGIILVMCFIVMIMLFVERSRNQKKVVGHTFCEIITAEGKSYKKLVKTQPNGLLIIPPTKEAKGLIFCINKDCLYDSLYPDLPGFMRFICAEVKKALLHVGSAMPLSNMGNVLPISATGLYNIQNEAFTNKGVELSTIELMEAGKAAGQPLSQLGRKKQFSWTTIIIIGLVLILLVGGVLIAKNWNAIQAALGK